MFGGIFNKLTVAKDAYDLFSCLIGSIIFTFICSIWTKFWEYFGSFTIYLCLAFGLILSIILLMIAEKIDSFLLNKTKKKNDEDLRKKQAVRDIDSNARREQEIEVKLIQATTSENPLVLYKQCMILATYLPEYKKKITEDVAKQVCGENATQEQKSIIYTILSKYEPFRVEVNKLLETKGMEAIKHSQISKLAIDFLTSITDDDLAIIKKQFKYVMGGGIVYFHELLDFMRQDGIWYELGCAMKFDGAVWTSQLNGTLGRAVKLQSTPWQLDEDTFVWENWLKNPDTGNLYTLDELKELIKNPSEKERIVQFKYPFDAPDKPKITLENPKNINPVKLELQYICNFNGDWRANLQPIKRRT
jgi:hypothetical protein